MSAPDQPPPPVGDPYAAWRSTGFRWYLAGNVIATLGMQMQTAIVGLEVYERTGSTTAIALVGLFQVIPFLLLALPAGHLVDHFPRRRVLMLAMTLLTLSSLALCVVSRYSLPVWMMYVCLTATGASRTLQQPAKTAFLAQLVPRSSFTNAVTWSSGGFQLATVLGPAMGGLLVGGGAPYWSIYLIDAVAALMFVGFLVQIAEPPFTAPREAPTLHSLAAGVRFVGKNPIILGAITLDMLAVLIGGAVALLPVYRKILGVDEQAYGLMCAAQPAGALAMAVALAHRRPFSRSGVALLFAVAGFGAATILFGLSRTFWLSVAMLVCIGGLDFISVVIRQTLIQTLTPDELRGRVSAVNSVFISTSNELGAFESGIVATLTTPTISVVAGGIGTILVVLGVAALCPPLRKFGRL